MSERPIEFIIPAVTYEHEVGRRVADAAERVAEEVGEEAELALAATGPHLAGALQPLHGGAVAVIELPHRHSRAAIVLRHHRGHRIESTARSILQVR